MRVHKLQQIFDTNQMIQITPFIYKIQELGAEP